MIEKGLVILSGGMDSTTLLYKAMDYFGSGNVHAISFDYSQKHLKELECAIESCMKLNVPHKMIDVSVLNELAPSALTRKDIEVPEGHYADENMKQTVVPNRNMVLISLATSYAISVGAKTIWYGAHRGDHDIYPDCRKEFVEAMKKAVSLCDWAEVKLEAPFVDMDKGDIVILGHKFGVDYNLTWTCYKGQDKACGKCGSCVERLEAFQKAGVGDPIEYV
jgi:7-cyano-7-deazaguanine synthase